MRAAAGPLRVPIHNPTSVQHSELVRGDDRADPLHVRGRGWPSMGVRHAGQARDHGLGRPGPQHHTQPRGLGLIHVVIIYMQLKLPRLCGIVHYLSLTALIQSRLPFPPCKLCCHRTFFFSQIKKNVYKIKKQQNTILLLLIKSVFADSCGKERPESAMLPLLRLGSDIRARAHRTPGLRARGGSDVLGGDQQPKYSRHDVLQGFFSYGRWNVFIL